jgi:nicotinamide mononucleotide transporter
VTEFLHSAFRELLATSLWELAGVTLALAYLLLAVRRSQWCWPSAFVSTCIYLVLMARAHLYMQTVLQLFYLAMAVYGYLQWRQNRDAEGELAVVRWPGYAHAATVAIVLAAGILNGRILSLHSDAHAPYLDSFVTWGSVITTWMVTRRVLENWLYWIVVDALAAYLYFDQGLRATALLFLAYIGIVIHGYFAWRRTELQRTRSGT